MKRTYFIRIEIRPAPDLMSDNRSQPSISPECLASKSVRARLGIFQVNDWREIARHQVEKMGFTMGDQFGRHPTKEWPFIAFIHGTFSKDGRGRCGSSLMRMPCKMISGSQQ